MVGSQCSTRQVDCVWHGSGGPAHYQRQRRVSAVCGSRRLSGIVRCDVRCAIWDTQPRLPEPSEFLPLSPRIAPHRPVGRYRHQYGDLYDLNVARDHHVAYPGQRIHEQFCVASRFEGWLLLLRHLHGGRGELLARYAERAPGADLRRLHHGGEKRGIGATTDILWTLYSELGKQIKSTPPKKTVQIFNNKDS